jgi:hypothetical protein
MLTWFDWKVPILLQFQSQKRADGVAQDVDHSQAELISPTYFQGNKSYFFLIGLNN